MRALDWTTPGVSRHLKGSGSAALQSRPPWTTGSVSRWAKHSKRPRRAAYWLELPYWSHMTLAVYDSMGITAPFILNDGAHLPQLSATVM